MTARNTLIGLGAGFAAALLYLGLLTGSLIAFPFSLVSPLPIAIAGIGFGTLSGAVAAATASALLTIAINPLFGILYLISYAAPTAWVAHLVGLSRASAESRDQPEWYPLHAVLLRAGLAAALSMVVWTALRNYDAAAVTAEVLDAMTATMADVPGFTREELEPVVRFLIAAAPFLFAFWAVIMLVLNIYIGARIVRRLGLLQRPWQPLWTVHLPRIVVLFFGLTLAAAFIDGAIGQVGAAFAGAFAAAFALTGLGFVHAALQGRPAKRPILWLLYVLTFLFSPTPLVMCLVGVADSLFDLRARRSGGPAARK